MQRYDFMSNHVSFSNRFWVSILDPPHRVYRLRLIMKKKQVNLKHYLAPQCAIVQLKDETPLLATSGIEHTTEVIGNKEEEEELEFENEP